MRRGPVLGNGFVYDVFDLLGDDYDNQIALAICVTIDRWNLELKSAQQVVAAQCDTAPEFDKACLALEVDEEGLQIVRSVSSALKRIDSSLHARSPPYPANPHAAGQPYSSVIGGSIMGKAGRNETKKVAANFLNGAAIATLSIGYLGPMVGHEIEFWQSALAVAISAIAHAMALRAVCNIED